MIRLLFLLILVPIPAFAEALRIRSGEHPNFSRLVVSVPAGSEWRISENDIGYSLVIDEHSDGFITDEVFERIPRDRLNSISNGQTGDLLLSTTCDCYVDAFLWREDRLVIDIIDGQSPSVLDQVEAGQVSDNFRDERAASVRDPFQFSDTFVQGIPENEITEVTEESETDNAALADAELALIEGLARAASQGFLNAVPALDTEVEVEEEIEPETLDVQDQPFPTRPGVGISTALDRDLANLGVALGQALESQCLPVDLFAVRDWANEAPFHEQAAPLIEALAGDFGLQPVEAQEELARFYVYFGFGAEARIALLMEDVSSQSRQLLLELAKVVDGQSGSFEIIASQSECESAGAMWAFLTSPRRVTADQSNLIEGHFLDLPKQLRRQIAPRMAESFIAIGEIETANRLLDLTRNHDSEALHETVATRALVSERMGASEVALAALEDEVNENIRTTPESLIRLIDLALEQGQAPKETDLLLAATMRQEYKGDPVAAALEIAEARGYIALGQYRTSLRLVAERVDPEAKEVQNTAYTEVADNADTAAFLDLIYDDVPEILSASTQNAIARRLIDLGFPERALDFLQTGTSRSENIERRYLRAESFILLSDFSTALEAIQGLTDERARALRAKAYSRLGSYREALSALGSNFEPENGATLQFRAEAWDRLNLQEDEALSSFAGLVLDEPEGRPTDTLADRRDLLEESVKSRRVVEELLLRFEMPLDM